ncbi:Hypothetical protein POVR1_LOCUS142 [uncultured virus]|nr:Hypothetical protein POVR1_LOCUS142 [uncultured virus]
MLTQSFAHIFVPIFALLFLGLAEEHTSGQYCPYTRELHANRDNVIPPGGQADFFDENFTVALTFGCGRLYNASWPAFIKEQARQWLLAQFGIDWTLGTPLGNGAYLRPEGIFFPFVYGNDFMYRIHSDKVNCRETKPHFNWFIFNSGYLVRHSVDGVYPGGIMQGTTYRVGEIISHTEYNFLNEERQDKWGTVDPRWRQKITIRSRQPGHSTSNSLGGTDQQVYEELVDQENNNQIGFASFTVTITNTSRWIPGGPVIQSTRNTMTWPHAQTYPNPFPALEACTKK